VTGFRAGLVQMTAGADVAANIAQARAGIRRAADQGAALIATPEMTSLLVFGRAAVLAGAVAEADDPALAQFTALARELERWLLIGSLAIRLDGDRVANRSFLIGPDGRIAARYDKLHMFDADPPSGPSYRESRLYAAGDSAVLAATPWGPLGMTICYDMRFPHLYRALAKAGASIIAVPSAFTRPTGKAHWRVLLRARAIETGCFILAPAQTGRNDAGRETFGHSLIVAPWGEVLADAGEAPGVVLANIDLDQVARARARIPSLNADRAFTVRGP